MPAPIIVKPSCELVMSNKSSVYVPAATLMLQPQLELAASEIA